MPRPKIAFKYQAPCFDHPVPFRQATFAQLCHCFRSLLLNFARAPLRFVVTDSGSDSDSASDGPACPNSDSDSASAGLDSDSDSDFPSHAKAPQDEGAGPCDVAAPGVPATNAPGNARGDGLAVRAASLP